MLLQVAVAAAVLAGQPGGRQDDFASAAREYGVPVSVLLGVSYLQSRWDAHAGEPSTAGGYGPMHLLDPALITGAGPRSGGRPHGPLPRAAAPGHQHGDARGDAARPRPHLDPRGEPATGPAEGKGTTPHETTRPASGSPRATSKEAARTGSGDRREGAPPGSGDRREAARPGSGDRGATRGEAARSGSGGQGAATGEAARSGSGGQGATAGEAARTGSGDRGVTSGEAASSGGDWGATLGEAARLTGVSVERLRRDAAANIRAGAALLASYQGVPSADPARWHAAVARYSGSPAFADEVLRVIRDGAARRADDGSLVRLPAHPALRSPVRPTAPEDGAECPPSLECRWMPAAYARTGEQDYGNHDRMSRPRRIDYIVIHDTEGPFRGIPRLIRDPEYVSWHYTIRSRDGQIAQHVKTRDIAWHAGNWDVNTRSVGIEHEGYLARGGTWYTEAMYRASARLVRHLAAEHDIPLDRAHILGHDNVPGTTPDTLATMHEDPGPYWDWAHYFDLLDAPFDKRPRRLDTLRKAATDEPATSYGEEPDHPDTTSPSHAQPPAAPAIRDHTTADLPMHHTAADPTAHDGTAADPATHHHTPADPAAHGRTAADPAMRHHTAGDPTAHDQTTADRATHHPTAADLAAHDRTATDPAMCHHTAGDPAAHDGTATDPAMHHRTPADPAAHDQTTADPATHHHTPADLAALDRPAADPAARDQTAADTIGLDQAAADAVVRGQSGPVVRDQDSTGSAMRDQTAASSVVRDGVGFGRVVRERPRRGGSVLILPEYDEHRPRFTGCKSAKPDRPCPPHGASAVWLHTAPRHDAPLVDDIGKRVGEPSTYSVYDHSARVSAGQRFAVAGRRGDWTAIWYLGRRAWFHDPHEHPTAVRARGPVVVPRNPDVKVYGRAYPEKSAYRGTGVAYQPHVALPYRIGPGEAYTVGDTLTGSYHAAGYKPASHVTVRGRQRYHQIQLGHRVAFVKAEDVRLIR
ncbi:N-acetylmuramoyl-L-alanine amidase [Nonomuraea sp. NPDC050478]|uniref:N-acetylmuramoyl-L-alanine amidase n=1 Tax=Nonomuraea sp. NPDC050478 TaxID=3364365 RepID=UPI0037940A6A